MKMIMLFEDINSNENSMVRDKKSSTKASNNNRRTNWFSRIISRMARFMRHDKSVISSEEKTDAQVDQEIGKAIDPGLSKQQSYALAEMNG
jgi:hypothetical protein